MEHFVTFRTMDQVSSLLGHVFDQEIDFYEIEEEENTEKGGPFVTQYFRSNEAIPEHEVNELGTLLGVIDSDFNMPD